MIRMEFLVRKDGLCGFICTGHSMFAESGSDIVCSAVSALTINCVNSIEKLTADKPDIHVSDGSIRCILNGEVSAESALLLKSLQIGVSSVAEEYPHNVTVTEKSFQ
ncbi:MAG: ribosomal-processing cysteine protease Prp [Lachnospiraceae bacterium]|nr:ribosomal-processing cysteine protease Prp [Lachnospiraceae bacterium]